MTFVGLGPGDPNLLTIAAVKAINNANIVAYPVAYKGAQSIAKEIAACRLRNKKLLPIYLPMVTDKNVLNECEITSVKFLSAFTKNCEKLNLTNLFYVILLQIPSIYNNTEDINNSLLMLNMSIDYIIKNISSTSNLICNDLNKYLNHYILSWDIFSCI